MCVFHQGPQHCDAALKTGCSVAVLIPWLISARLNLVLVSDGLKVPGESPSANHPGMVLLDRWGSPCSPR